MPEVKTLQEEQNRTYHEAQSHMEFLPNYYRWIYGQFVPFLQGRVVELGAGAGLGIATYLARVDHVYAVDYNDELLRRVEIRFPANKVTAIKADLLTAWEELGHLSADAVIIMDVLEHFEDDETFMLRAVALARPGGYVIVKVPAQKRLFSEMDQASGHFRRYDLADLTSLGTRMGLDMISLRHINPIGALAYRFRRKRKTNFSRTFKPRQLRVINAMLPLLRIFDAIQVPYGLSLVAVFRKPSVGQTKPTVV